MTGFAVRSPAFGDGEPIPRRYGYTAENVNPPLEFDGIPDAAETLALVMDDPDALEPAGTIWDHWVLWNLDPERTEIPEGWAVDAGETGVNDFGESGYGGPNPPDGEHTYRFQVYALDTELSLPGTTTADDLRDAVDGHVLARATLEGTYAP